MRLLLGHRYWKQWLKGDENGVVDILCNLDLETMTTCIPLPGFVKRESGPKYLFLEAIYWQGIRAPPVVQIESRDECTAGGGDKNLIT